MDLTEGLFLSSLFENSGGGGGGGLTYVIPEQTVTITDAPVEIQVTGTLPGENEVYVCKIIDSDINTPMYGEMHKTTNTEAWWTSIRDVTYEIGYVGNKYMIVVTANNQLQPGTYTISAISGF